MNVTLAPIITEKTMKSAKTNKFTFKVSKNADKRDIKKAVEKKFNVNVLDVLTIIVKPKKKRTLQRTIALEPSFKKAVVKVKDGQKIDIFDVGGEKKK